MKISPLGDDSLPADPGADQVVADWATSTNAAINSAALNASIYVPASSSAVATPSLSQWLSQNSTMIVAGCALIGLLIAVGKK